MPNAVAPITKKEARPIYAKRANTLKTNTAVQKINVALYPNPTNGELIYVVLNNDEFDYKITTSMGQVLQTGKINATFNKINLSQLTAGVYLITITNNNYTQTDRIILQ